jgi:hypothetical protein
VLLYVVRWLERWLHQHIFKVGWLVTKNFLTTTIIYYLFFLPGEFINELSIWMAATIANVRADTSIRIPDQQEIAELKLDFVKTAKNVSRFQAAFIALAPLAVGIFALWIIANQALKLDTALLPFNQLGLEGLPQTVTNLTTAPGFWLWVYIAFTIANSMFPHDWKFLRGWKIMLVGIGIFILILYALGVGEAILGYALAGPLYQGAVALVQVLAFVIVMNIFATALLGIVEAIIERITGDSATFQHGKLVAVRRKDLIAQKAQQKEKAEKAAAKAAERANMTLSIYSLPFPTPGGPDKVGATVSRDTDFTLPATAGSPASTAPPAAPPGIVAPTPSSEGRAGAGIITATPLRVETTPVAEKVEDEDERDAN